MKLDETTRLAIGITERMERVAGRVRNAGTLPPWQMPMDRKTRDKLALEAAIKQYAMKVVGGA
ncbi:MAG: hypothetical protein WC359_14965 [Dehalococcoidia bacterium]|jgi:hypothetical protein